MLLDIEINSTLFSFAVVAIIVALIWGFSEVISQKEKVNAATVELLKKDAFIKDKELAYQQLLNNLNERGQEAAMKWFEEWKNKELLEYKRHIDGVSIDAATVRLQEWIGENEERIRKDAAHRSLKVNLGRVSEHLLPFSSQFKNFNPKDARFIGSPIDLIVFDGVADNKDEVSIYFIEVKTGSSTLSATQKKIMRAIVNHRVYWLPMSVKDKDLNLELEA